MEGAERRRDHQKRSFANYVDRYWTVGRESVLWVADTHDGNEYCKHLVTHHPEAAAAGNDDGRKCLLLLSYLIYRNHDLGFLLLNQKYLLNGSSLNLLLID